MENKKFTSSIVVSNQGLTSFSQEQRHPASGLRVNEAYLSAKGNIYMNGFRATDHVIIQEHIGQSGSLMYLNKVEIYERESKFLIAELKCNEHYSRERASEIAAKMLVEAMQRENPEVSRLKIMSKVQEVIQQAYFQEVRAAILHLSRKLGII